MVGRLPATPGPSPEQEELDRKWKAYAELREQLVALEADHQTLEAALGEFEHNHLLRCGSRYTTIDSLEAEIAELRAARSPKDKVLQAQARAAREKARESAQDFQTREQEGARPKFKPTPELKALYRRVARRVHPDLADNEEERRFRHDFMVELNACYARGDHERIQQIAMEWEAQTGEREDEDVADQLVRVIRIIANMRKRIASLEGAITALEHGELARLKRDVEQALAEGRDMIGDLLERLDERILGLQAERDRLQSDEEAA